MNTSEITFTAEEIESNYNRFRSLCEKLGDRAPAALALVDYFGERLAICPASAKKDYHRAIPGGLVDHSLRVLQNALTLTKAFDWFVPKDSLILATLFHDIGKLGDLENDYYVAAEPWRAEKLGETYTYNSNIQFMANTHRSLYLCQHFGLKLTQDETLAILLNDGFVVQENKQYCLKEPLLAHVVMTADIIATRQEKGGF